MVINQMPSERNQWLLNKIVDKDGKTIGTMLVDTEIVPDPSKPWRFYLTFPYEGRPLPHKEEFDAFDLADRQIQELCKKFNAHNVAIWMANGVRDWIIYIEDPEVFKSVTEIMLGGRATVTAEPDPEWKQHRTLLDMVKPVPRDEQR